MDYIWTAKNVNGYWFSNIYPIYSSDLEYYDFHPFPLESSFELKVASKYYLLYNELYVNFPSCDMGDKLSI